MSIGRRSIIALVALMVSAAATAQAQDDSVVATSRGELDGIEAMLQALSHTIDTPEQVDAQAQFARRLYDAKILFLLGDPMRASLILYDAIDAPEAMSYRRHDEAEFYLGESLFAMRHDLAARDRFDDLVRRGSSQYITLAVQRLIQIADRTGRYDGVEDNVASLRESGLLPPDVGYIWAKSQVLRGQAELAKQTAAMVQEDSRLWAKARYITGVAEVQLGHYSEARTIFEQLASVGDSYEEAAAIRDLSATNAGRILLDQGDLVGSVDDYQKVNRNGQHFDQSSYEATWNYVRAADAAKDDAAKANEYGKAQRALEIMLLSSAENDVLPEARLLYGNILIKLARFDEADIAFQHVVDRYRPARNELQTMLAAGDDPRIYYDEVVTRTKLGDTTLPPIAVTWARNEKPMQDALRIAGDLDQSDVWLDGAVSIADELLQLLGSDSRATLFPEIRDEQSRAHEIEGALTAVKGHLLQVKAKLAGDRDAAAPAVLAQVDELRARAERDTGELQNVVGRINTAMADRVAVLEKQVLSEKGKLEALAKTSKLTRVDTERAVGDVAAATVRAVAGKFKDIVMRADVGIIDVAWQVKEQQTAEINRRVSEQRRELEVLDSEFKEVLAE